MYFQLLFIHYYYLFVYHTSSTSETKAFDMYASNILATILVLSAGVFAYPSVAVHQDHLEILRSRANKSVNPAAVTGTKCIDTGAAVVFHGWFITASDCYSILMLWVR